MHDNCNCGCGHGGDACGDGCNSDILTLDLGDGKEIQCQVVSTFEVGEKEYVALMPVEAPTVDEDAETEEDDLFIYRLTRTDDGFQLDNVEDDEEFEEAVEVFYSTVLDDDDDFFDGDGEFLDEDDFDDDDFEDGYDDDENDDLYDDEDEEA